MSDAGFVEVDDEDRVSLTAEGEVAATVSRFTADRLEPMTREQ